MSTEKILLIANGVIMLGVAVYMKIQEDRRKAEKEKQRLEMEKEAHDQKLRQDEELHRLVMKIKEQNARNVEELNSDTPKGIKGDISKNNDLERSNEDKENL